MRGCEQTHSDAYSCWKMAARSRQTDKVVQTVAFFLCISFFFFQTNRLSRQRSSGPRWLIGHSVYKRAEGLCEVEKSLPRGGKTAAGFGSVCPSAPLAAKTCKHWKLTRMAASFIHEWSIEAFRFFFVVWRRIYFCFVYFLAAQFDLTECLESFRNFRCVQWKPGRQQRSRNALLGFNLLPLWERRNWDSFFF